ncbi:hypothetical protein J2X69_004544 [Algoriphagus sp. 4150]|uniref:hypothetical protein n=1 Tax=Algoriphagus sp. 4150 TaxID=2817756 RepID=UPI00285EE1F1|nr:hypothetical protein [Algoriphagus sp. 4150]MDR7132177.1 hypothetical protein [Algoriphagus sp. 4150]
MNKYSPKQDLWSKIQQRKDFDLQVKEHVANLPERMPKADLWNTIESELDHKTPVVALWKYRLAAASIALILALSGIAYLEFGYKDVKPQLITEVNAPSHEFIIPDKKPVTEAESTLNATIESQLGKTRTNASPKQPVKRETIAVIELPKLDLEDLVIENTVVSELKTPSIPEPEELQTLHKVKISWGFQDNKKLQTTFGSRNPENIDNQQIGRSEQPKNSIKINFQKQ